MTTETYQEFEPAKTKKYPRVILASGPEDDETVHDLAKKLVSSVDSQRVFAFPVYDEPARRALSLIVAAQMSSVYAERSPMAVILGEYGYDRSVHEILQKSAAMKCALVIRTTSVPSRLPYAVSRSVDYVVVTRSLRVLEGIYENFFKVKYADRYDFPTALSQAKCLVLDTKTREVTYVVTL